MAYSKVEDGVLSGEHVVQYLSYSGSVPADTQSCTAHLMSQQAAADAGGKKRKGAAKGGKAAKRHKGLDAGAAVAAVANAQARLLRCA